MFPSPDTSARATPSLQWVPWPPLAGALRFPTFIGLGSEVAHSVARVLATVRRSNRACRFPAHGFHEDSSFRDAPEGIDGDRVMRPVLTVGATRFIMNGPSGEPVELIQNTSLLGQERTGFSLRELFRPLSSLLVWFPFPSRPSSPAAFPDPFGRRLPGRVAFVTPHRYYSAVGLLTGPRSPLRFRL